MEARRIGLAQRRLGAQPCWGHRAPPNDVSCDRRMYRCQTGHGPDSRVVIATERATAAPSLRR